MERVFLSFNWIPRSWTQVFQWKPTTTGSDHGPVPFFSERTESTFGVSTHQRRLATDWPSGLQPVWSFYKQKPESWQNNSRSLANPVLSMVMLHDATCTFSPWSCPCYTMLCCFCKAGIFQDESRDVAANQPLWTGEQKTQKYLQVPLGSGQLIRCWKIPGSHRWSVLPAIFWPTGFYMFFFESS